MYVHNNVLIMIYSTSENIIVSYKVYHVILYI